MKINLATMALILGLSPNLVRADTSTWYRDNEGLEIFANLQADLASQRFYATDDVLKTYDDMIKSYQARNDITPEAKAVIIARLKKSSDDVAAFRKTLATAKTTWELQNTNGVDDLGRISENINITGLAIIRAVSDSVLAKNYALANDLMILASKRTRSNIVFLDPQDSTKKDDINRRIEDMVLLSLKSPAEVKIYTDKLSDRLTKELPFVGVGELRIDQASDSSYSGFEKTWSKLLLVQKESDSVELELTKAKQTLEELKKFPDLLANDIQEQNKKILNITSNLKVIQDAIKLSMGNMVGFQFTIYSSFLSQEAGFIYKNLKNLGTDLKIDVAGAKVSFLNRIQIRKKSLGLSTIQIMKSGKFKHCDEQSKALLLDIVSDMNKVVDYRVSEATIEQIAKKYAEIFPAVSPAQDDAVDAETAKAPVAKVKRANKGR